ncbi:MAG: ribosome biogenesis GTPase Der, partial [Gammaproteobacteria bacterium]|nr:ribosome biogenesis GTPase Der [Gammaproteobacteria bacterium]
MTRSRDALVADYSGLTRDRHYGLGVLNGMLINLVDTGGFLPSDKDYLVQAVAGQTKQAVYEADIVLFVVDARSGIVHQDYEVAEFLRQQNKTVLVIANKSEGASDKWTEFFELGFSEVLPISAEHGDGIHTMGQIVTSFLKPAPTDTAQATASSTSDQMRLAVVGRPNVGKSTLINTLLGEDRLVVFDVAGTTRDSIEVPFQRLNRNYTLIDTAGVRKRTQVSLAIEKFSVIKTLQAIDSAHVVVQLLDATQGIADQDLHILSYIIERGRALVLAVNKWDAIDSYQRKRILSELEVRFVFLKYVDIICISATKRHGLSKIWLA